MARYELGFKTTVTKDLRDIPKADLRRIPERIESLRDDPGPFGCEKRSAQEHYRIRQGNHRILYEMLDLEVVVEGVKSGYRREVYRGRSKQIQGSRRVALRVGALDELAYAVTRLTSGNRSG